MIVRSLLMRGLLAGLFAGVVCFAVAFALGEPQLQQAVDLEAHLAGAHGEASEPALVSRDVQRTLGLALGTCAMGTALGGLLSLMFAWVYGRVGLRSARVVAAALAAGAYVTVVLVPFTKYPANPPGVGSADTIDRRTVLYVAMVAIAMLAALGAFRMRRHLLSRLGPWHASLAGAATFVVLVVVSGLLLPGPEPTPAGFPADLLWRFRLASLAITAAMWTAIGFGFGALAHRFLATQAPRSDADYKTSGPSDVTVGCQQPAKRLESR